MRSHTIYMIRSHLILTWLDPTVLITRLYVKKPNVNGGTCFSLCSTTSSIMNRTLALRLARRSQAFRQLRLARASSTAATTPQPARHGHLPGNASSAITSQMHFFNSVLESNSIPTYRVLDGNGVLVDGAEVPEVRGFAVVCPDTHIHASDNRLTESLRGECKRETYVWFGNDLY